MRGGVLTRYFAGQSYSDSELLLVSRFTAPARLLFGPEVLAVIGILSVLGIAKILDWATGARPEPTPEFANEFKAVAQYGPAMREILRRRPSQLIVDRYQAGNMLDVPHSLVYAPGYQDVPQVIWIFRHRHTEVRTCDIKGSELAKPDFFDLTIDCH
jgi:hypothetical protein